MKQIEMNNKKLDQNDRKKFEATEKVKNAGSYLTNALEEAERNRQLAIMK